MSPQPTPQPSGTGRILSVRQSLLAMLGLCFVTMLVAVDQTVVGTALPTIVAELNGFELYAWVATSYLLTSVITIPIFGRLGDYYGRKPFVVASIVVFTLASALCGMADTMLQLVLARALQGIGGGMLVGTAFACVPDLFTDTHVRLRWQVLMTAAFGIANAFGPSLGGFLTQYAGWRSVFYVNLPIGAISLYFVWRFLPHIRQIQRGKIRLHWQGAVLIALGLGSLQVFVELLPVHGASFYMVLLGALAVAAFFALVFWEKRCPEPLLPLEMFRNKSLAALFCLSLFTGFIMFVLLFYLPLLLQGGFGLTPQEVGLLITPLVVFITVGSVANSRIVVRLNTPNHILYLGFGLMVLACLGLVFSGKATSRWMVVIYMMMAGTGLGFVMPNLTVFAQESAGRALLGISTALLQSVRMIGGMLGMAVIGTLVTHYYVSIVRLSLPEARGAPWLSLLEDPQVLVSQSVQSDFMAHLQRLSLQGDAFIETARAALVSAVHLGLIVTLLMAVLAFAWVCRVPVIRLSRTVATVGPGSGEQP
ncbi:MFS transporter [Pollutimonas bauzanensis]|uniref:Drug resistance transporter, EmrB/QacA subfamily n=1 Tax=Pollutimonas bauzanensis TaxID=658167 RepID=A0A1M5ZV17_9BURK|nr:MFS transporter [Pollutimonas bauzanensis]SHI28090.1 drug resistance transporter, EmrB/QacA subfamily [Pollutimonas bauzanensis]